MQCPGCDRSLKPAAKSCACGWKSPDARESRPALADPDRGRCAWIDFGVRCVKPGAISHGTKGEGPWFCRFHFFGQSLPEKLPMPDSVRELAGLLPQREPGADEQEAA